MIHKAVTVAIRWPFSTSGLGRIANIRGAALRFLLWCLWLFGGLLLAGGPAQAETNPGDILIVDQLGGTNNLGALLLVDPKTGHRTVLSDFGVPQDNQAPLGAAPASIAVGSEGRIFVSDLFAGGPPLSGALFEVDPDTGTRTLLSNFGQGNIQGFLYYGLAVDKKGKVIATFSTPEGLPNSLVRITPDTDKRALVTDLTNPAQGGPEADRFIKDLVLEGSGKILIGTATTSGQPDSAIFWVHPETDKRTLLSDFANAAQGAAVADLWLSTGLAIEASGQILVAAGESVSTTSNLLLRIDSKTGQRKVFSDSFNQAQGPALLAVTYIAVVPKASDDEDDD
jgi:sugar lactone lactonase YvrE